MWANGFRPSEKRDGYKRKAIKGCAVFVGALLFGLAAGGLAELAGGWGQ